MTDDRTCYLRKPLGSSEFAGEINLVLKCKLSLLKRRNWDSNPWFPPGLENRENLEKWEGIFQSGNFVKTGKVGEKSGNFTQDTGKLKKILEKSGKFVRQ